MIRPTRLAVGRPAVLASLFLAVVISVSTQGVPVAAAEASPDPAVAAQASPRPIATADPSPEASANTSGTPEPVADDQRPDIIVVMVGDLAFVEDQRILERLPNINKLFLEQGLRFARAFDEIPVASPARANFWTGQYSRNNGITVNSSVGLDLSQTIATALDDAGYFTMFLGKFMNDYNGATVPPGFDRAWIADGHDLVAPKFFDNGERKTFKGRFFDDVTRERAVKWLKQAPMDRPVFQMVSPYAPRRHTQQCVGKKRPACTSVPAVLKKDRGDARCDDIPRFRPPSYSTSAKREPYPIRVPPSWAEGWRLEPTCESLLVIDRMIGQLADRQAERDRPAYFVFMSDNGMSWGQHGYALKLVPWATQLPLYVSGPDVPAGSTEAPVSIIDIPVTLAQLGGAEMPWADGVSFGAALNGEAFSGREQILEQMPSPPEGSGLRYLGWEAIREGEWRYTRWETGERFLHNMAQDPWELDNLARDLPDVAAELDAKLDQLLADAGL